jgi:hypothetical protein
MDKGCVFAAILMLSMALVTTDPRAAEYESGFDFEISVPDVWLVLTRSEVVDHAEMFLADDGFSGLRAIPLAMRRMVYDRVRGGELEILYRMEDSSGAFIDNINILVQPGQRPTTPGEVAQICSILPTEFSRVFGRPISMDACEMRDRIRTRALYLQFDGAVPGTTTLQYQIHRAERPTLILTATASTEGLPRMMSEFEEMIASIRLR